MTSVTARDELSAVRQKIAEYEAQLGSRSAQSPELVRAALMQLWAKEKELTLLPEQGAGHDTLSGGAPGGSRAFGGGALDASLDGKRKDGASMYDLPAAARYGVSDREGMFAAVYKLDRPELWKYMLETAYVEGAVLIKAPPESGKTAMLHQAFMNIDWLKEKYPAVLFESYFISLLVQPGTLDNALHTATKGKYSSWDDLAQSPPSSSDGRHIDTVVFIFLDEAHTLYHDARFFARLKLLHQGGVPQWPLARQGKLHLRVIMASAYGLQPSGFPAPSTLAEQLAGMAVTPAGAAQVVNTADAEQQEYPATPFSLKKKCIITVASNPIVLGVPTRMDLGSDASSSTDADEDGSASDTRVDEIQTTLSLSPAQYKRLCGIFTEQENCSLPDDVATFIYSMTAGQVGLVSRGFCWLASKVEKEKKVLPKEALAKRFKEKVTSHSFLMQLAQTRSVPSYERMTARQERVIKQVLDKGYVVSSVTDPNYPAVQRLYQYGVLVPYLHGNDPLYVFSSPVHAQLMAHWVYRGETQVKEFGQFIESTIRRMSPRSLQETTAYTVSTGRPYEYVYQFEFYRAAYALLPFIPGTLCRCIMSPSVGQAFGSNGYLDFYVSDVKWGFELRRDDDERDIEEHVKRFLGPSGMYFGMVKDGHLERFAVLDLRSTGTEAPDLSKYGPFPLLYVSFKDAYRVAHLRMPGQDLGEIRVGDSIQNQLQAAGMHG